MSFMSSHVQIKSKAKDSKSITEVNFRIKFHYMSTDYMLHEEILAEQMMMIWSRYKIFFHIQKLTTLKVNLITPFYIFNPYIVHSDIGLQTSKSFNTFSNFNPSFVPLYGKKVSI